MSRLEKGVNDLYTWCLNNGEFGEQLMNEWVGEDENGYKISIDNIPRASNKKVKWMCAHGHEWYAAVVSRTMKRQGCPQCYKAVQGEITRQSRLKQGVNDFETWCFNNGEYGQQLLSEWVGVDENNNSISANEVTQGSHTKVKWRCANGHEWFADLCHRTSNRRCCPYCFGNKKISKDRSLQEWCKNNGEYGQQLINEWVGLDENNQPISMDNVARAAKKKVKWRCKQGHEWFATICSRTNCRSGCPRCSSVGTSYSEQYLYYGLKQLYPSAENRCRVLKSPQHPQGIEFDIGIPDIPLCIEYSATYWHEGKEEYDEYKKQICSQHSVRLIQIIEDNYNELEEKLEDDYICFRMNYAMQTEILQYILEHILKTLNHTLDEIDLDKVEEDVQKAIELKGVQQGVNDLKTWCLQNGKWGKQLIDEWTGLDENGIQVSMDSVARATPKKIKWRCANGHEWIATISNRTNRRSGCPYCAGKKK